MKALRTGIATLVVAAVALAIGVGVMAATGGDSPRDLQVQSSGHGRSGVDPALRAEHLRSEQLNRLYGLGRWTPPARRIKDPARRAEFLRSDALNRKYKLGRYAPGS